MIASIINILTTDLMAPSGVKCLHKILRYVRITIREMVQLYSQRCETRLEQFRDNMCAWCMDIVRISYTLRSRG